MSQLNDYTVTWTIEIEAASEVEAARKALEIQRDPQSMATVFRVDGESIDLEEKS